MIVHPVITTPNPDRWVALATALGAAVATHDDGAHLAEFVGGRLSIVTGDSPGEEFGLEPAGVEPRAKHGSVHVAPLLYTQQVEQTARRLAGEGLRRRLTSDSGDWADLVGDGIVGVHIGEQDRTQVGFEAADVEALQQPLADAGFRVALVDEAYGRTLRVEHPDNPDQDAEIWINETQTDTYGYTQHEQG